MLTLSRKQIDDEDPQLNITPLLDVLFVLLMLFILIAPFLQLDRVQLTGAIIEAKNLTTANFETRSELLIEVDNKDHILINNQNVDITKLETAIKSLGLNSEKIVPLLIEDQKSTFGTFETIKQTLEKLGFKQLDVVLKTQ
jgi:biopolymer transport protein ExbD